MDLETARKRLADERARVEQEIADLGGRTVTTDESEATEDKAVQLDQIEREEALREELKGTLAAIERAEKRVDDGSYGKSVVSGESIPEERLDAVPWADRLVSE
jgi:DnaK suppressor protein